MQNIEKGYAHFQEKYSKVCITRAAVKESVFEDFHTEHVQIAGTAVSTSVWTIAKVIL